MTDFETLFYCDGSIEMVSKPPILDRDGRFISRTIRAYQRQLHTKLIALAQENPIYRLWDLTWQPDEFGQSCYAIAKPYYQAIAQLLTPKIDCDRLEPMSRHLFFVCTEPITVGDQKMLGLSRLEILMGYALTELKPEAEAEEEPSDLLLEDDEPVITTGDFELDVLGVSLLVFKTQAIRLATIFNANDLSKLNAYTSSLMKRSQSIAEKKAKEEYDGSSTQKTISTQPIRELPPDPVYEQNEEAIFEALQKKGLKLPTL